jgi:hypothetical protein
MCEQVTRRRIANAEAKGTVRSPKSGISRSSSQREAQPDGTDGTRSVLWASSGVTAVEQSSGADGDRDLP